MNPEIDRGVYDLNDRMALVAVGAGGIGNAIAEGLASFGATVAVCSCKGSKAAAVAETIGSAGGQAWGAELDIRDHEAVGRFVENVIEHSGRLDVPVKSVGTHQEAPAEGYR
jgi:NAD(P)-dependent dehydrogenase (short-subunit alcohol dehydrogenase family)